MKTALSYGLLIQNALAEALHSLVTDIYPIETASAALPYVAYRRAGLDDVAVKNGRPLAAAIVEVSVYSAAYGEGVGIAEQIAETLDGWSGTAGGIQCRGCNLQDAIEDKIGEAYEQRLIFRVRI